MTDHPIMISHARIGQPLTLSAYGIATANSYQWFKNGTSLGKTDPIMKIDKVTYDDAGFYLLKTDPESPGPHIVVAVDDGTTVTDIDNNIYGTVLIGNQRWTTENLRTTRFNLGTPINNWPQQENSAAYCFYQNTTDPYYQIKWGALYNWYAVNYAVNTEKLAPNGWRVATKNDWEYLQSNFNGSNKSVFTSCHGPTIDPSGNRFDSSRWWCSDIYPVNDDVYTYRIGDDTNLWGGVLNRSYGCSIRLVQDVPPNTIPIHF